MLVPGGELSIVTEGDLSVVLAKESPSLWTVRSSDGRGVAWSAPVDLLPAGSPGSVLEATACLAGDRLIVQWLDTRFAPPGSSSKTPFVRVFDGRSLVGGPEIQIPTGSAADSTNIFNESVACTLVDGDLHIHYLARRFVTQPGGSTPQGEIFLVSSQDGGTTWQPATVLDQSVPPQGGIPGLLVVGPQVLAEGLKVHAFWERSIGDVTLADTIRYQRSSDGGLTQDFLDSQIALGALSLFDFHATVRGDILAIGYTNLDSLFGFFECGTRLSLDGGDSFGLSISDFEPTVGVDLCSFPFVIGGPGPNEAVAAFEITDFFGDSWILAKKGSPSGETDGTLLRGAPAGVPSFPFAPKVAVSDEDRDRVAVTWREDINGDIRVFAAFSYDGGDTFGSPQTVSNLDSTGADSAWNELYQNVLATIDDSAGGWVGGLRAQAIEPTGWTLGSTQVGADFLRFGGGADLAYTLLSTISDGFLLPLGDGRELGLGVSPLFNAFLPLALSGPLAATLDSEGMGSTPGLSIASPGVPAGLTFEMVGLSLDLDSLSFVDISDRVQIQIN